MSYFLNTKPLNYIKKKFEIFFVEEFPFIAALPALIWQVFFSIVPVFMMAIYSVIGTNETENFLGFLTLDFYKDLISLPYFKAIYNSLVLAVGSIAGCLLFSFPVAYLIAFFIRKRYQPICMLLMMIPLWTNFIVRIYSWFFLLDKRGVFSMALRHLGLIDKSTQFLFNPVVTIVGMIYCYYPFMLLPIYLTMSGIRQELVEASSDLGANTWQTLRFLIFPYCIPDMVYSSALVGLMAFGEFAIPEILGGARYSFWGSIIASKFTLSRAFKSGAAYTFIGIGIIFGLLGCFYLVVALLKTLVSQRLRKTLKNILFLQNR